MAGINKKIMAFTGTEESVMLVSALAEHTDSIYAAVSDEYGISPHPGGNITLISKYLDEERMRSWIDRVGVDIVIDGTDISAEEPRSIIKKVCGEKEVEYLRLASESRKNTHTAVFRNDAQLLRELEYTVGNILVEGCDELYDLMTGVRQFQQKVFIMIPADADVLNRVIGAGYSKENIISINRTIHADLLIAIFREFGISNYVFSGSVKEGMQERLASVDRSSVKAAVYGELEKDEGMSAEEMWSMLSERFGIED